MPLTESRCPLSKHLTAGLLPRRADVAPPGAAGLRRSRAVRFGLRGDGALLAGRARHSAGRAGVLLRDLHPKTAPTTCIIVSSSARQLHDCAAYYSCPRNLSTQTVAMTSVLSDPEFLRSGLSHTRASRTYTARRSQSSSAARSCCRLRSATRCGSRIDSVAPRRRRKATLRSHLSSGRPPPFDSTTGVSSAGGCRSGCCRRTRAVSMAIYLAQLHRSLFPSIRNEPQQACVGE